ncbi:FAD-dependent monooxygenase [Cupriavidus sp. H18C2]|uniref:NAD(P)/FAD-dependent oxidoreductase n=1 Tax=Cupriavidus sp. H18C2 TaxID=3241602 RepID=UPI003BF80123
MCSKTRGSSALTDKFDVAVVGAGPAGLTAAIRLRQLGRSVLVLHRVRPRPSRVEALTPGVADILRYLRADGVLADAGATLVHRHRVAWATHDAVTREPKAGEASLLVQRHRFDKELAEAALAHGVLFRPSSRMIAIESSGEQQLIRYAHDGFERVVLAKHVLEATGRPRAAKRKQLGPSLIAISASFEVVAGIECEMLVEALDDGWVWAARQPGQALHVTAFGDPGQVHLRWPGDPQRALSAMLASSAYLGQLGDAGVFEGGLRCGLVRLRGLASRRPLEVGR